MSGRGGESWREGRTGGGSASGPVIVVGTAALDRVVRLSGPLAPGSKLRGEERGARLGGGAANTALALARAGRAVRIVATLGFDTLGDRLLEELREAGIDIGLVRRVPGGSPGALILIDPAGERTVIRTSAAAQPRPFGSLDGEPASCLFARGDAPGLDALMEEAARTALVVAHVPPLAAGSRPAHVLVGSMADLGADFLANPVAAGRRLAGDLLRCIVVTRGPLGAEAYPAGGGSFSVPAARVPVVDSTGAGDVFAAGLIDGLLEGLAMEGALRRAVAWGTASVGWDGPHPGPGFPPPDPA